MKLSWRCGGSALALVLLSVVVFGLAGCEGKKAAGEGSEAGEQEKAAPAEEGKPDVPVPGAEPKVAEVESEPKGELEEEREDEPGSETPAESAPSPSRSAEAEPEVEPKVPGEPWTLEHAGFAAQLPQDVDLYLDARKLKWVWDLLEQLKGSEAFGKFFTEWMDEFLVEGEEEAIVGELKTILPMLMKEEAFVATRGAAMVAEAGVEMSQAVNSAMGRDLAKAFASGDAGDFMTEEFGSDMPKELSRWLKRNVKKLGEGQDIAFYAGGRLAEKERKDVRKRVAAMMSKAVEETDQLKAAEWTSGAVSWTGFEFSGTHVPAFKRDTPPEGMDKETWAELQEALRKMTLVVACAEVQDFVVVAVGLGRDSIKLAEVPENSLAAAKPFQFLGGFEAKAMMATSWMSKRMVSSIVQWNRGLPVFEGMAEGLEAAPPLRRKAEMLKAIREFISHQKARGAGTAFDHVGAVLAGKQIRYETRGGWLGSGLDLESPLKFAGAFAELKKAPFVQGHWKLNEGYLERGHKQVDAAMRTARLISEEVMESLSKKNEDDEEMAEQMVRWKRDLVKGIDDIWHGYRDHFATAFGREWAFVMDLQGEMIPAVGLEEEVVKKGRIPRAAFVRPVVKREALGESWKMWQRALTNMFGIVAEAFDQPIPFPDTMTAEKDDLRTYFFPFPFATDDFLPSVSVSDELFILGSSKTLSEDVYAATLDAKPKGGAKRSGLLIEVNAEELWPFCEIWLDIYEENRAARKELEEDDLRRERENEDGGDAPAEPKDENPAEPGEERKIGEKKAIDEIEIDPDDIELRGPLGLLSGGPSPEVLRTLLEKARWLRALSYRRWVEDGVPRGSLRVKWAAR